MSDDLLVECPIHLDAVSITDILVFKCGHGFCEPCLEEHFAHHAYSGHLSCPTCRKTVRRNEAFPLFLTPAQPTTGTGAHGSQSTHETSRTRMVQELREVKAVHASCSGRFTELQLEIDTLRQDSAYHNQTIQHLRDRYHLLEERLAKEADSAARSREESDRMKEEVAKLQVENHKTSRAHEEALQEVKVQLERVKVFQGYVEQYKKKCSLEKKKRKAVESVNHHLVFRKEDDSLMVVDANAPDTLHQDGPDFGWLDEACKVKGDQHTVPDDEDLESEDGSEEDVRHSDPDTKREEWEDQAPGPPPPNRSRSDWNLELAALAGTSSGATRRQRDGSKQVGGSRIVKVKIQKAGGPLAIDRQGRIKGTVALGSKQRLNSKN